MRFISLNLLICSFLLWSPWASAESKMSGYQQKVSRLNTLDARVKESRKQVETLINAKNSASNQAEKEQHMKELVEVHKRLGEEIKEYNQVRAEIEYRFPEKDDDKERKYLPFREQTVEQIEKEMGLDSKLTHLKKSIDKKYESFSKKEETEIQPKKVRKKKDDKEEKKLRLEL